MSEPDATLIHVTSAPDGGREMSQRLAKIENAIFRRKTIMFSYYSMQRDEASERKVDPYHLVFRGGQFYLIGHSHERDEVRVFRLSRIRGKVSYATKAEHDFPPPRGLRPPRLRHDGRLAVGRDRGGRRTSSSGADHLARRAPLRRLRQISQADRGDGAPGRGVIFETDYASGRQLISWVLGWRENAHAARARDLATEAPSGSSSLRERTAATSSVAEDGRADRRGQRPAALVQRPLRGGRSAPSASPAWSPWPGS